MERVIIAAVSENGVIGKDGDIPWHYPEDLKRFKEKTTGHPVIMGRGTFESLPQDYRPLPNRTNIVLSRSDPEVPESVKIANSLEEAWKIAEEKDDIAFVIGGANVYEQVLDQADRMEITRIHDEYDGDTFFPEWDEENWKEVEREDMGELSFITYIRD